MIEKLESEQFSIEKLEEAAEKTDKEEAYNYSTRSPGFKKLQQDQKKLPATYGVYLFLQLPVQLSESDVLNFETYPKKLDDLLKYNKKILYIGKAKNLKKRTEYYFKDTTPYRLKKMVYFANKLVYLITANEEEALLLESNLIKANKPLYNVLYKSGCTFFYIYYSDHIFPSVKIVNYVDKEATNRYIGPFISYDYANKLVNAMQHIFKLRSCTDYYFQTRKRPCLKYQLNLCSAPCISKNEADLKVKDKLQKDYLDLVKQFVQVLKGNVNPIVKLLKAEIKKLVKLESFEIAEIKNEAIGVLTKLSYEQRIFFKDVKNIDIVIMEENYRYKESIRDNSVVDIIYRKYDFHISMDEFLLAIYITQPKNKVLGNMDANMFERYINVLNGKVSLAERQVFEAAKGRFYEIIKKEKLTDKIEKFAGKPLRTIEIYDNSHYNGKFALCAMVVYDFVLQKFIKNKYRVWRMKTDSKNDLLILETALKRRLEVGDLPDLILLDGGKTQLGVALASLGGFKDILAFTKDEFRRSGFFYAANSSGKVAEVAEGKTENSLDEVVLFFEMLRSHAHDFAKSSAMRRYSASYSLESAQ